ncbi:MULTISPECIES: DUF6543 domain-containing protein [unclassified Pseudomonas]|uniref:dermonecrotic toxin domain-containing protein n=1 Tax=unclassified Pseudomonas TaxID=196821 RepID=UPI00244C67DF|nr:MULTISPECIES: DUF6543 domain-containing protein [unclassified Pseudomonas]MDH0304181.1 hypothetical protein [Pseudomonas sp. GD04091]MDH1986216.1 hypothetical protein [Pseudomonas sp. GD03689]
MPSTTTLKGAVAYQFASRPTLRQVVAREGFKLLARHYPLVTSSYPHLDSLAAFTLMRARDATGLVRYTPLLDHLLEVFLEDGRVAFSDDDHLSLDTPHRFRAAEIITKDMAPAQVNLRLSLLNDDFNQLLAGLVDRFRQAQVCFWNGSQEGLGIIRAEWMTQVIKAALARNIEHQGLTEQAKSLLYGVLMGDRATLRVDAVECCLNTDGNEYRELLPNLLISGESEEGSLLLWCEPFGTVRAHDDDLGFARTLRDTFSERYRFDTLSWSRSPLQGDPFAQQARLLLQCGLERIGRLKMWQADTVEQLETSFQTWSDPSTDFPERPEPGQDLPALELPAWLSQASSADRFEYQMALQEQSARQALSRGATSLDGIEDLHGYTVRRLREQMQADHPGQAPCDPDELTIALAVPDPAIDPELPASLKPARNLSLTELAYTQPAVETLEVVTGVTHAGGGSVQGWMTPAYVNRLLTRVDIGGTYPSQVGRALDDSTGQPERLRLFASEWRSALLFQALRAKIEGHLDEPCWQVLAAFCRSKRDFAQYLSIAPLAFKCAPGARTADQVSGMFVIRFNELGKWMLYRPLYEARAILAFADLDDLMRQLREPGDLQQSVLDWLPDDVRAVYDDGGFGKPHLHDALKSILHLLTLEADNVATYLESLREPVKATPKFWLADLDARMYQARSRMLAMLTARQTVSNAQRRWAIANQLGWLLFNLVTPMLPGPLASVAWLAALVHGLPDDFRALANGDDAQKSLALVDLLNNLAMLLVHGHGAKDGAPVPVEHDTPVTLAAPPERSRPWEPMDASLEEQGDLLEDDAIARVLRPMTVAEEGAPLRAMDDREALQAYAWSEQRFNTLTPSLKARLATYEASVSLVGRLSEKQWPMRGLVEVDGPLYLELDGQSYEVRVDWGSARIVAPDGREGPWLRPGDEGWVLDLGLKGGSGRGGAAGPSISLPRYQRIASDIATRIRNSNDKIKALNSNIRFLQAQLKKDADNLKLEMAAGYEPESEEYKVLGVLGEKVRNWRMLIRKTSTDRETTRYTLMVHADELLVVLDKAKKGVPFTNHEERHVTALRLLLVEGFTVLDMLDRVNKAKDLIDARARAFAPDSDLSHEWPAYQDVLREAVNNEEVMADALDLIDKHIGELPPDISVDLQGRTLFRHELIDLRERTYVDYRFHIAMGYANLALDVTKVTSTQRLLRVSRQLAGLSLRVVSAAHSRVLMSEVSTDDRLEILQAAWRRYGNAIVKADVLLHRDTATYSPGMIEQYKKHMEALKKAMAPALLRAQAQLEGTPMGEEVSPYPVKTGYRAVRTRAQTLVIASEAVQADGTTVLQVLEPFSNRVLLSFEADAQGDWVQAGGAADLEVGYETESESGSEAGSRPASEPRLASESETESESDVESGSSPGSGTSASAEGPQLIDIARHLQSRVLADSARVESIAQGYVEGDAGVEALTELVNAHLQALDDARSTLLRAGENTDAIDARIGTWQANKESWLTELYRSTHYPDLEGLRFLFERGRLKITYSGRSVIANGSAMDEYTINWLRTPHAQGKGTDFWVAHFHFQRQADVASAFVRGHLKTRAQRKKTGIDVHYGRITYEQVKDIIPFNS